MTEEVESAEPVVMYRAECSPCADSVIGDLQAVTSWAVRHAYARELAALDELRSSADALARYSRALVIEVEPGGHQVAIAEVYVDPRPYGRDLER